MKKRVETINGWVYTYRVYKNGDEAFLFKHKLPTTTYTEPDRHMTRDELIDAPYPRVSPDVMFDRAWRQHHF